MIDGPERSLFTGRISLWIANPSIPRRHLSSSCREGATATLKNRVPTSTRDLEIISVSQSVRPSGRLETSMSLGRIAGFLGDICRCFGLPTLPCISNSFSCLGASQVHKFSNEMRFEGSPGVKPPTLRDVFRERHSYLRRYAVPGGSIYP